MAQVIRGFKSYTIRQFEVMMNTRRAISQALLEALLPAVRNKETGKLTIGKRGDYHSELIARTNPKSGST